LNAAPGYLDAAFLANLGLTLYRTLAAFVLSFVLGTALGIGAYMTGLAHRLNSVMLAVEVIPGTILGVILLLMLGLGSAVPIVLATCLTLPTIAINTANALSKKEVTLEGFLRSAGGGRADLIRYLYLPTLVPIFQSNANLGFGMALKVVVLGEFIGCQDGIGYLLNVARIYFGMKEVFFYLCVVLLVTGAFQVGQSLLFGLCLEKYFYAG
jgi:NitT/TauT family transport system permease protein